MKKKKSTGILLDPLDYWERKLCINYESEYIRYKKLCMKLTKKEMRKLDGAYYTTYSDWEKHMTDAIQHLDSAELYEYIHFLRNLSRRSDTVVNLVYAFLFPLAISMISLFMLEPLQSFSQSLSGLFCALLAYLLLLIFAKYLASTSKDDALHCSFYADIMHLSEKQLENIDS